MFRWYVAFLLSFFAAYTATADVVVPSTAKQQFVGTDMNRNSIYKVGSLYMADSSGNTIRVMAPSVSNDLYTWKFPGSDGDADQCLVTDGDGNLSWASTLQTGNESIVNADISPTAEIEYGKLDLTGEIVNADINASAAIAYSKLNLGTSILNSDINASAAIAYSKLNLGTSILNSDINASAAIAYSKLNLSGAILNADIASGAAIAYSKLNLASSVATSDLASGLLVPASKGGTGVSNNDAATLTRSGNHALTLTTNGTTGVTLPTTGTLATLAGTESLSNKKLIVANGAVIAESASGTGRQLKMNWAGSVDNKAATFNFQQADNATYNFPDVSGTLATTNQQETFTNKTLTAATLNDYVDVNEESAPSSPAAGAVRLYAKSDKKLYTKNSDGSEAELGAGAGGAGELNLIGNPSDSGNWSVTGWPGGTSGGVVTHSTTGELPLEGIIDTALAIYSDASAAAETSEYVSYAFTTPPGLGVKLKVEFYIFPTAITHLNNEWTVSVYNTAGPTRQPLSTDNSTPLTYVPPMNGKFTTTFDAAPSTSYTLRFARPTNAAGNGGPLVVSNIIVGPGIQPQGAVIGPVVSFTPTASTTFISGGTVTPTGKWWREGQFMWIDYELAFGGAAGSGNLVLNLPSGYTIDTTAINSTTSRIVLSVDGMAWDGVSAQHDVYASYNSTTNVTVRTRSGGSDAIVTSAGPFTFNSGDYLWLRCKVPIAAWAGSGTTNLAQNDVQYLAWDGSATTYGPAGAVMPTIAASATNTLTTHTLTPIYPVQASDSMWVEYQKAGAGPWAPVATGGEYDYTTLLRQNTGSGARYYGIGLGPTSGASTLRVVFGNAGAQTTGTSYGATGSSFPTAAGDRYRVVVAKSGQAVSFGAATATASGLVSSTAQTFGGAKTFNGAIAASGGFAADTGAYATVSAPGIVSTTTQTFNGAKTFDDGFSAGAGETITYTGVYEASHTFTDGGTWSKSGLVSARRFGDMVFLSIRALGSGASASSTDIATAANLSSGSGMRPSGTRAFHTVFYDNGAYIEGVVQINASGQIKFLKGLSGGSNAWTASGTKGIIRDQMLIYSIN